jgi:hypothetical protein
MEFIKRYKVVIAVVLPILILVLIRSFGIYHFKSDAKKWAEPSVIQSNIITREQFKALPGEKLIINMGEDTSVHNYITVASLNIPPDSVLSKNYIKTIRKHDGPVVLISTDPDISARIWMILSQMGCRNIFILTSDADNEELKHKFRSDTLVRPEL